MAIDNSIDVIAEVQEEFYKAFGRKNSIIEEIHDDDADVVLVTLGSMLEQLSIR